jgi:hypothetical protein
MSKVRRREQRSEYQQTGERECPEAEVTAEGAQRPVRTRGKIQDEIAGDREASRRQEDQEKDHGVPRCIRGGAILLRLPGEAAAAARGADIAKLPSCATVSPI